MGMIFKAILALSVRALAIEGMARDIVRQNDEALRRARAATIPPYIPGLHR